MIEMANYCVDKSDASSASLFVLEFNSLPWIPQRIYYMKNFVDGTTRGNHAHKKLNQVFVVVSGSLELTINIGLESQTIKMSEHSGQIILKPGAWRVISNASRDAVLMVLADAPYDESDYIRDWDEYLKWFSSFENEI